MNTTTLNSLNIPTSPMTIKVRIDDIKPFDRDPRKAPNEKYERIRESIRAVGLQQQLSITKRPHEDHYILRSGGGTRLKALKELYAETNEKRFGEVDCHFVPYTNDLDLLSLHISGNEPHAEMLFIDVAFAIKKLKGMIENDIDHTINLHELAAEMKQHGWFINEQKLPCYMYATEIADDLPIAFAYGMGLSYITHLRILENQITQWANERNFDIDQCIQIFRTVLRKNDSEMYSIIEIERDLFDSLSSTFMLPLDEVQNYFDLIQDKGSTIKDEVTNNG